jgi:hypothetical protein
VRSAVALLKRLNAPFFFLTHSAPLFIASFTFTLERPVFSQRKAEAVTGLHDPTVVFIVSFFARTIIYFKHIEGLVVLDPTFSLGFTNFKKRYNNNKIRSRRNKYGKGNHLRM